MNTCRYYYHTYFRFKNNLETLTCRKNNPGCSLPNKRTIIQPFLIILAFLSVPHFSYATSLTATSPRINHIYHHRHIDETLGLQHDHRDNPSSLNPRPNGRLLFLEAFFQTKNYVDDFMDVDADADDDDNNFQNQEKVMTGTMLDNPSNSSNASMHDNGNINMNMTMHVHPWGNYTNCRWYTLSHYVSPQSVVYDAIQGFLIALLLCLIIATGYNYLYYCCLIKYGCCPDERVTKSLLSKRGRRRKRRGKGSGSGSRCCGCFSVGASGRRNNDGKGLFMPLSNNSSDDDSENSSVSLDSALSLEYGDDHLHNEFGEITSRWDDAKIEDAARDYFHKEDQESEHKLKRKERKKRGGVSFKSPNRRSVKCVKSGHSRNNKRRERCMGGSQTKSQASSILSSSSENSFVSFASSSSGSHDAQEMESAMMDLELVKRSIAEKGYV